ncbi:MAG TPA: nucleotidyltransferase domain-containing protein [Elusimicrobiales bacterium]|jgi:predicted nucleotidyltransferase|nr:nucleotidyltransferase domain-containing protein [Elusimicrobiales bacterium]HPO95556.1 nucleotidyltransferase domain-containing protein [Elusimicrobiales bacterium]
MNEKEAIEKIKSVILEECKKEDIDVLKIILFGSRARGDSKKDSDWDVYVVVRDKLSFDRTAELISKIKWRLALMDIPNDIIIRSEDDAERYKDSIGFISYYARREGINIWMR